MSASKPWADGPYKLITSDRLGVPKGSKVTGAKVVADEMIVVHNFLLRIVNSIYLQSVNVETAAPEKVPDFVRYSLLWCELVREHHHGEETEVFPEIEQLAGVPGLMDHNVEQHAEFHGGFDKLHAYLQDVEAGKDKYDGTKVRATLDEFMPTLWTHLNDEIATLVALEKYDDKCDWEKWYKELMERIMAKALSAQFKSELFPIALMNHEKAYEGGKFASWPPIPWFVGIILKLWYFPMNKNLWIFASCDGNGKRKELPFA